MTLKLKINVQILQHGSHLMNLPLPEKTLVVMVKRKDKYFIPTGNTLLYEDDKLLVITNNQDALAQTYQSMGVKEVTFQKN